MPTMVKHHPGEMLCSPTTTNVCPMSLMLQIPRSQRNLTVYPSTRAGSFVCSGFGVSSAPPGHIAQHPWGCFDLCVTACLAQAFLKLLSVGAVHSRGAGVHGEPSVGLLDVGAFFLGNFWLHLDIYFHIIGCLNMQIAILGMWERAERNAKLGYSSKKCSEVSLMLKSTFSRVQNAFSMSVVLRDVLERRAVGNRLLLWLFFPSRLLNFWATVLLWNSCIGKHSNASTLMQQMELKDNCN